MAARSKLCSVRTLCRGSLVKSMDTSTMSPMSPPPLNAVTTWWSEDMASKLVLLDIVAESYEGEGGDSESVQQLHQG